MVARLMVARLHSGRDVDMDVLNQPVHLPLLLSRLLVRYFHTLAGIFNMLCRKRSSLLMVGIGLLVGFGVIVGCIGQDNSWLRSGVNNNHFSVQVGDVKRKKKCWVFNHMNKAGGSTVKYMLKPWIEANDISLGLYDSSQWQEGKEFADKYLDSNYTLTWGAYTEGLRPHGAADCDWFTIFRQ